MYKGRLIDELIATVEHAEASFRLDQEQESKLAYWYAVAQRELSNLDSPNFNSLNLNSLGFHSQDHALAGVA